MAGGAGAARAVDPPGDAIADERRGRRRRRSIDRLLRAVRLDERRRRPGRASSRRRSRRRRTGASRRRPRARRAPRPAPPSSAGPRSVRRCVEVLASRTLRRLAAEDEEDHAGTCRSRSGTRRRGRRRRARRRRCRASSAAARIASFEKKPANGGMPTSARPPIEHCDVRQRHQLAQAAHLADVLLAARARG